MSVFKLPVVWEYDETKRIYGVYCPFLDGAFGQGETPMEAKQDFRKNAIMTIDAHCANDCLSHDQKRWEYKNEWLEFSIDWEVN